MLYKHLFFISKIVFVVHFHIFLKNLCKVITIISFFIAKFDKIYKPFNIMELNNVDLELLKAKGISPETIEEQLKRFETGFPVKWC